MPVISEYASDLGHVSTTLSMIAGSSNFITDAAGDATQHLEYLPASTSSAHRFGEPFIEERINWGTLRWIQSVYVVPAFRRKGIFSEIYEFIIQMARENLVPGLRLYVDQRNTGARYTYDKLGMAGDHYSLYEIMF